MTTGEGFARWIEEELARRNWQPADLARLGDLTPAQVSRVLSGQRGAGLQFYEGVARGFRLPLETVLREAGVLPKVEQSAGESQLLAYYREVPERDRRTLLAVAYELWRTDQERQSTK